MATLRLIALGILVGACGDIQGFSGEVPPLATFRVQVDGDFEAVRFPDATQERLHVAMVWGDQWLPEPLCFLPAESPEVQVVLDAGCRDSLGFVPQRVSETLPIEPGVPIDLVVQNLPTAEVLVGDVTARIAYAAVVVFDDRDRDDRLQLDRSRTGGFGMDPMMDMPDEPAPPRINRDIIYASSFVSMTEPDVRIVLREGAYNERAAFYPRVGCGDPPPGFSVAAAGGFSEADAIAATIAGTLPAQDPSTCRESLPSDTTIALTFRAVEEIQEVGCLGRRSDASVRYREPPDPLDLDLRVAACAKLPTFGGKPSEVSQYIVSTQATDTCAGLVHYVLRGCDNDPLCELPEWDRTNSPPSWWPCGP